MSILHIAPRHVDVRPGQGSHKDVAARKAYFTSLGVAYCYVNVDGDDPTELADILGRFAPSHVFIEYSYFPRMAEEIRRRFPHAYIAVRAHNIEPMQGWAVANWNAPRDYLRNVYAFVRIFGCDLRMASMVDHIYVIASIEARRYWRWLGAGAKVSWLPYIPPPEMRQAAANAIRDVIACLPGGAPSRRTFDLVNRFAQFALAAKGAGWPYRFVLTGNVTGWKVKLNDAVEQVGHVGDLQAFYRSVRAAAILSPIGYGFKTTIADAICSGALALLHPTLGTTVPEELRPYCVMLQGFTPADLDRAAAALAAPKPGVTAAEALMRRFDSEMSRFVLRGAAAGDPAVGTAEW